MSWKFDAPSGTYRNHALSTDIRRQAIANTVFMPFARNEPGYGRKRGEAVTIMRTLALPLAGRVTETDRLPSGRAAIESKTVSVSQWGFKIPMTELEMDLSMMDLEQVQKDALRDQIKLTMDVMVADALKMAPNKYTPESTGGTFTTDATYNSTSDRNLGIQDLRRIHDELAGTLLCPPYRNGKYIGILSTRAARGIKNDPEYKDWQAPTTSGPLIDGRLRDVENFILIESNNTSALADLAGNSTTTGEAVFFGADAVGLVTVRDPEIRMGVPDELGTHFEVGWVGTLESFLVWERATAGHARVIHVGSN